MNDTKQILEQLKNEEISIDEALEELKMQPYEDLGFAKVDLQRKLRKGVAEVVYGAGKTAEQITSIIEVMRRAKQGLVLVTRVDAEKAKATEALLENSDGFEYHELARIITVGKMPEPSGIGKIVIATGGTSDIPVAEEAAVTAEALGNEVERLYDVGVAGIHRLFDRTDEIVNASVIIAVAGMEGALASVVGGLASCPVIAVPTSVGYGASFEGLSALLSMLNSCAAGISTVNIDNGFGAGYFAHKVNHMGIK